jgi:chemotaxis protein methyltransferase CheR
VAPTDERRLEALEMDLLLEGIARRHGYDFRHYARASLTRRIRRAVERERLPNISALQERVLRDPACLRRFIDAICVHTTSMFRDSDFYLALRREVVPLMRTYPFVRVWHAGCSTGEEVYSLAILLDEEGLYDRCRIYATDLNDTNLDRARAGVYPLRAMRDYTAAYQQSGGKEDFSSYYVADHDRALFRSSLRRNVLFSQHDLVADGAFNEFQLVLCRNVMIYFDDELRARVLTLIHQSLVPLGIVGLGKKESLQFSAIGSEYREIPRAPKLYRRVR